MHLSQKEVLILQLLRDARTRTTANRPSWAEQDEASGLDLVSWSDGKLGRSSVYPLLARLQNKDLVSSRYQPGSHAVPGVARQRVYKLSPGGRRRLVEHEAETVNGPSWGLPTTS